MVSGLSLSTMAQCATSAALVTTIVISLLYGIQPTGALGVVPCGSVHINPETTICCSGLVYVRSGFQPGCCNNVGYDARHYLCCGTAIIRKKLYGGLPKCCGDKAYDSLRDKCDGEGYVDRRTDFGSTCCQTEEGWRCCPRGDGCCDTGRGDTPGGYLGSGTALDVPGFKASCCDIRSDETKARCCRDVTELTGVAPACCSGRRVLPICCRRPEGKLKCCTPQDGYCCGRGPSAGSSPSYVPSVPILPDNSVDGGSNLLIPEVTPPPMVYYQPSSRPPYHGSPLSPQTPPTRHSTLAPTRRPPVAPPLDCCSLPDPLPSCCPILAGLPSCCRGSGPYLACCSSPTTWPQCCAIGIEVGPTHPPSPLQPPQPPQPTVSRGGRRPRGGSRCCSSPSRKKCCARAARKGILSRCCVNDPSAAVGRSHGSRPADEDGITPLSNPYIWNSDHADSGCCELVGRERGYCCGGREYLPCCGIRRPEDTPQDDLENDLEPEWWNEENAEDEEEQFLDLEEDQTDRDDTVDIEEEAFITERQEPTTDTNHNGETSTAESQRDPAKSFFQRSCCKTDGMAYEMCCQDGYLTTGYYPTCCPRMPDARVVQSHGQKKADKGHLDSMRIQVIRKPVAPVNGVSKSYTSEFVMNAKGPMDVQLGDDPKATRPRTASCCGLTSGALAHCCSQTTGHTLPACCTKPLTHKTQSLGFRVYASNDEKDRSAASNHVVSHDSCCHIYSTKEKSHCCAQGSTENGEPAKCCHDNDNNPSRRPQRTQSRKWRMKACAGQQYDADNFLCCGGQIRPRPGFQPACCGTRAYDSLLLSCCDGQHVRRSCNPNYTPFKTAWDTWI